MENPNSTPINTNHDNDGEDLKKIIFQYLKYWHWFLISIIITIITAFIYLRYKNNVYQTNAQIKVLKEQSGLDLSALQGSSPLIDMSKVNMENEREILKSRRLAKKVTENLELSKRYFIVGNIKSTELWAGERPFTISWIDEDFVPEFDSIASYTIEFESLNEFEIRNNETDVSEKYTVGESMLLDGNAMSLNLNPLFEGDITQLDGKEFTFTYVSTDKAVTSLTNQLTIEQLGERSEILDVSIQGENKHKNEAVLNSLIKQFNSDGIEDNRLISKRTEEFVIKRLGYLVEELDTVESGLARFKSRNDLVEIENKAEVLFTKSTQAELRVYEISNQLSLTKNFKKELLEQSEYDLLPARIGIDNNNINSYTETYNDKILERERLLVSSTDENPALIELNKIIKQLRNNILNTINSYIKSLEISLSEVKRRELGFDENIGQLPQQERQIRIIRRQQEVKERLYLFLLQKREEAALSYAITSPIIKIVDFPYTQPQPVSPKSIIILLASLIIGLVVPFGILYIIFLFDTKIKGKDQIKSILPNIPIIAEIPLQKDNENKIILPNDKSSLAESFRIMRTNLNFMKLKDKDGLSNSSEVVFVTSTVKGEGKTFIATSIASALVAAGNKVLLMGCDLRNPQIHNYFNLKKNLPGVSNYLYDDSISFEDIIIHNPMKNLELDVVLSGVIPPNPSEILMNAKFEDLIANSKKNYDYVIIDTAPTILVTDTILISKYADITLYIARAGYTDTSLLPHIKDIQEQKKLINMGLVINGLDESGVNAYNYGYGYGYGESKKKKKFWKFRS